jgi:hypothetical protein
VTASVPAALVRDTVDAPKVEASIGAEKVNEMAPVRGAAAALAAGELPVRINATGAQVTVMFVTEAPLTDPDPLETVQSCIGVDGCTPAVTE